MNFQRIDKHTGAIEAYDAQRMYAFLKVNYGPRTALKVMEQFKSGRKQKFLATYAVFEVVPEFFTELNRADADPSHLNELSKDVTDAQIDAYQKDRERAEREAYAANSF